MSGVEQISCVGAGKRSWNEGSLLPSEFSRRLLASIPLLKKTTEMLSVAFQPEVFKPCRNPQFPHKTALRDPDVFNTPRKFSWSVISSLI